MKGVFRLGELAVTGASGLHPVWVCAGYPMQVHTPFSTGWQDLLLERLFPLRWWLFHMNASLKMQQCAVLHFGVHCLQCWQSTLVSGWEIMQNQIQEFLIAVSWTHHCCTGPFKIRLCQRPTQLHTQESLNAPFSFLFLSTWTSTCRIVCTSSCDIIKTIKI